MLHFCISYVRIGSLLLFCIALRIVITLLNISIVVNYKGNRKSVEGKLLSLVRERKGDYYKTRIIKERSKEIILKM